MGWTDLWLVPVGSTLDFAGPGTTELGGTGYQRLVLVRLGASCTKSWCQDLEGLEAHNRMSDRPIT